MNIEFKIADSYLNIGDDYWDELGAFYAENVWKLAPDECTKRVKLCFSSFEYEFAVKWYEISAMSKGKLVGFMRAMRDPDDDTRWFFADVHVAKKLRRKGIATKMYEKAIELVSQFESVKVINASVSPGNTNSIGLHEKFGFVNTGREPVFADFEFADETEFELMVFKNYPIVEGITHRRILTKLMKKYLTEQKLDVKEASRRVKEIMTAVNEISADRDASGSLKAEETNAKSSSNAAYRFEIIWNGNDPVGFCCEGMGINMTFKP